MSTPKETQQWLLKSRPTGFPTYGQPDSNFQLTTTPLPTLKENQVLAKTLFLSNDPAQRAWLNDVKKLYVAPVAIDSVMRARGLVEILKSTSPDFSVGDVVNASPGWAEYAVLDAKDCIRVPPPPQGLNYSHYLGALGGTGLTAYYGLVVIGEAKQGQTLVVSGAAGATGNMVVQIAKHIVGCSRVIGLAGTDEKCRWVESLGAGELYRSVCAGVRRGL
jgi:NADPH-dependent curcumin reductase CurA